MNELLIHIQYMMQHTKKGGIREFPPRTPPSMLHSFYLPHIKLDLLWPTLPDTVLYHVELRQDPLYPLLTPHEVQDCVEKAIRFGKKIAQAQRASLHPQSISTTSVLNQLLQHRVRVILVRHPAQDTRTASPAIRTPRTPFIRAQYIERPPTIRIHHSSLIQFLSFFQMDKLPVREEEVLCLHLCHEWFHHLEAKQYGYTSRQTPQAIVRRLGPVRWRRPVQRTREIAAHTFTRQILRLPWTPLLLDYLLTLHTMGLSKTEIREHFATLRRTTPV